ncbi:MAG: YlbF family regulator [Gemmatimonadota bacterium]
MDDMPDLNDIAAQAQQAGEREIERDKQNREAIMNKARELGRLISQTAEFKYLSSAQEELDDDREATEMLNRMKKVQDEVVSHVERGEEPPEDLLEEREELAKELQGDRKYQSLVSAQTNFDKLMKKVNRSISQGLKNGQDSDIIMPS